MANRILKIPNLDKTKKTIIALGGVNIGGHRMINKK